MEYQKFLEQVTRRIRAQVKEGTQVWVFPIRKNNGILFDSLSILEQGENISSAIYLNGYYQEYQRGIPLEQITREIMDSYQKGRPWKQPDLSSFLQPALARKRIVCRLINYEKNKELLQKIPYRRFLDLAIVYYYLLEWEEPGAATILVSNDHLRLWDMKEELLYETARNNTRELFRWYFASMEELLESVMGQEADCMEGHLPLYVLTNQEKKYGAVWITEPDVLEEVGKALQADFYILPSSVHECMIVPDNDCAEAGVLQEMVREINREHVAPEEILSDFIYRYDRRNGTLKLAEGEIEKGKIKLAGC